MHVRVSRPVVVCGTTLVISPWNMLILVRKPANKSFPALSTTVSYECISFMASGQFTLQGQASVVRAHVVNLGYQKACAPEQS